jgi:hypothetical protein
MQEQLAIVTRSRLADLLHEYGYPPAVLPDDGMVFWHHTLLSERDRGPPIEQVELELLQESARDQRTCPQRAKSRSHHRMHIQPRSIGKG